MFGRGTAAAGWAPDGHLYVGSSGSHLREFDPATFELVRDIAVPMSATGGLLKFSEDGTFVVTRGVVDGDDGSQTGSVARIDLTDGTTAWTIPPDEYGFGKCDSFAFSAPEGRLWCGDYFGVIRGRSLDTGQLDGSTIEHQRGWLSALDVIDVGGGRYLVSLGRNAASIGRWRVDGEGPITHLVASGNDFARYSPDGRWMVVAGPADNGTGFSMSVWDVDDERTVLALPPDAFDGAWVDDHRLAVFTVDGLARLIDVRTGDTRPVDLAVEPGWQAIAAVADGRVALGYPDGHVDVFDVDTGQAPLRLQLTNADWFFQVGVNQIAASPDGTRIYATGFGLYQFDGIDGRQVRQVSDTAIASVAVAADGLVAVGRVDGTIDLLESDDLSVQATLPGARGFPSSLHFSADGRYLLVTANDETMSLYDVRTRQRIGDAVDTGEADADLRPDGRQVAVANHDASGITLWDLDPSTLADAACSIAGRNLTRSEWDTYLGDLGPYRATCPEFDLPP
jgi:WD40 repeat protein